MKYILAILLFFFITTTCSYAATKYCGSSSAGLNNGSSWANQYACSAVFTNGSGLLSAGDTIYIDGGSSGITYTNSFVIPTSGSSGNYITIKPGAASPSPSGHNGLVTINPNSGAGIVLLAKNYIVISGNDGSGNRKIYLTNPGKDNGIYMEGLSNAYRILVEYIEIGNVGAYNKDSKGAGVWVSTDTEAALEFSHLYVHDTSMDGFYVTCGNAQANGFGKWSIHDSTIVNITDDGIESSCSGLDFYNNIIGDRLTPTPPSSHPDTFQIYTNYYRIYNNWIRNWQVDSQINENTIYYETMWAADCGHFHIYNNLFSEAQAKGGTNAICYAVHNVCKSIKDVYIVNNTFVGPYQASIMLAFNGCNGLSSTSDIQMTIENNIDRTSGWSMDTSCSRNFYITYGSHGQGKSVTVDYNNYNDFVPSKTQSNGTSANPKLDVNYKPTVNSKSVIDKGVSLENLFTTDKDGVARPQGSAWDMGAYEYVPVSQGTGK